MCKTTAMRITAKQDQDCDSWNKSALAENVSGDHAVKHKTNGVRPVGKVLQRVKATLGVYCGNCESPPRKHC